MSRFDNSTHLTLDQPPPRGCPRPLDLVRPWQNGRPPPHPACPLLRSEGFQNEAAWAWGARRGGLARRPCGKPGAAPESPTQVACPLGRRALVRQALTARMARRRGGQRHRPGRPSSHDPRRPPIRGVLLRDLRGPLDRRRTFRAKPLWNGARTHPLPLSPRPIRAPHQTPSSRLPAERYSPLFRPGPAAAGPVGLAPAVALFHGCVGGRYGWWELRERGCLVVGAC